MKEAANNIDPLSTPKTASASDALGVAASLRRTGPST